jgi:hypothetical protein
MVKEYVVGGAAAISASCITHPIDVLKVRMFMYGELQPSMFPRLTIIKDVLNEGGGISTFYKGLSATVLRQALFSTTRFGIYGHMKSWLNKPDNPAATLAATMTAGGVASVVGCPADVALVRMQSGKWLAYTNVFQALQSMYLKEGVRSWYKGVVPLTVRGMMVTSGQFITYDVLSTTLKRRQHSSFTVSVVSGMGAALAATVLSVPADVVKSRYMNSHAYKSSADCLVQCVRTEGVLGLYKGFIPAYVRGAPQVTLMWVFYEKYSELYDLFK